MSGGMKGLPLAAEDIGLAAWNIAAVPLLATSAAGPLIRLGDDSAPLAGLLQLAAVLGAIVAVATRPPNDGSVDSGGFALQVALIGPFIGAVALVSGSASGYLGINLEAPAIGLAFAAIVAAMAFTDRLPTLDGGLRRALLAPFVFVCAGIFDGLAADLLQGLDIGELLAAITVDQTGFGIFVVGLLVSGIAAFYAALVLAPRALVLRESLAGCLAWPLRFAVFLVSALVGIGWLTALAS